MEGTFLSRFFSKINAAYPTSGFVYGSKESTPPLHLLCLVALSFLLRSSSNRWTRSGEVVCWPICAILCLSGCPSSRTMFTLTCPRCSLGVTVFVTHQVRILEVKSWLQHYIFLDVLFLMKRADFSLYISYVDAKGRLQAFHSGVPRIYACNLQLAI